MSLGTRALHSFQRRQIALSYRTMRVLGSEGYAVAAAAVLALQHVNAWTTPSTTTSQQKQWTRSLCSSRASLMMEGEVVGSPSSSSSSSAAASPGTLVAEGTLVSFFRGGLAAVRIDDANVRAAAAATVATLGRVPEQLKSDKVMSVDSGPFSNL
jgi:hypothetical protein